MTPTTATTRQRMDALATAQDRRLTVVAVCRELKRFPNREGRDQLAAMLRERDPRISPAKVFTILRAINGIGVEKAEKFMIAAKVGPRGGETKVRELTERQRGKLVGVLEAVPAPRRHQRLERPPRWCAYCDQEIPPERKASAIYCSATCCNRAGELRRAERRR